MKQIYNFEQHSPPALNENTIHAEIEKRKVRRQTALLAIAGILIQIVMVILGFAVIKVYPLLTVICLAYVLVSTTGGSVIAVVCTRKGGLLI